MVDTGFISFFTQNESVQDENGNWSDPIVVQTEFIGCNLKVVRKEYIKLVDGQVKQAAYSLYVDSDKIDFDLKTVTRISLKDDLDQDLDEHQVMNIEYLELSKRYKIVV